MKRSKRWMRVLSAVVAGVVVAWGIAVGVEAQTRLRYSCSAQIHEAFGDEGIQAFSKAAGIEVEKYVTSSFSAVYRLMNDFADIASTTRGLYYRQKESGYVETAFCKDPLTIIVNDQNPVTNLTDFQLQEIFSGHITNWKEVGGPDQTIVVVVPGKNTAAYKNFDREAMKRKEIIYDFMTYKSTMAIEAVKRFPWAVSFIAQAAASGQGNIKMVAVNGIQPLESAYPFHQMFSFVTKGEPAGAAKAFVDFVFSDKGKEILKKKGMIPLHR